MLCRDTDHRNGNLMTATSETRQADCVTTTTGERELFPRSSGILLHPTSLPGRFGIGDLGPSAFRFVDWLTARIQESVFGLKVGTGKIPFTNKGGTMIQAAIEGPLSLGVARGGLAADPKPEVNVPDVSTVSAANKSARNWPDITFTATLAGAVHTTVIAGTVSV